ncbi:hypothetical protein [Streptomyces sp. NPDC127033]|uniref:hypothetical protein n=1 Tax=Streptomyces sp. NPDC127033 TaxID=3347110 RepID=UPI003654CABA
MSVLDETRTEVGVEFDAPLSHEQRIVVEHSVQAMAAHVAKERDEEQKAEAAGAALGATLERPLLKLIENDPSVAQELQGHLASMPPLEAVDLTGPLTNAQVEDATLSVRAVETRVDRPPYDFSWSWHRQDGSPPFRQAINRPAGRVDVDARSGSLMVGGAPKFVDAHAGFGLFFRPPANGVLVGDSLRRLAFGFVVAAYGIGSWAVSEGGTEHTILEDGQLKQFASHKLWRKRLSVNEFERFVSPTITDTPMPISFPVKAGHDYTFNVGFWVRTDNRSAIGRSCAQAIIAGLVPAMTTTIPR